MNPHNVSCMSFETSSQNQTILHFPLATTPQSFRHFERTPFGSIGGPSAYCVVILIIPCCILLKDCTPPPLIHFRTFVFPALLKTFPLDLEEIIVGHIDVEGYSMKKVGRVIHSTSIVKVRIFSF
jgi:hypothetical protein